MTINQLHCFTAVAKNLSFAKAAESLYLSKSAVSRQIKMLEDELGAELFYRNRQTVTLTASGSRFYSEASDILERINLSKENILKQQERQDTLSVGFLSNIYVKNLSEIYGEYHKLMPHVVVNNMLVSPADYHTGSMWDRLNVLFLPIERKRRESLITDSLSYTPLYNGFVCCVMPKGHRLSHADEVCMADLSGETLIFLDNEHCSPSIDEIQMKIRRYGNNLSYFYSSSSFFTAPMIEGGLGVAVMPDFVCPVSDKLVKIPFQSDQKWEYDLVWRSNDQSAIVQNFVSIAKRMVIAV